MKEPKKFNKRGNIIVDISLFAIIAFVILLIMFVVNLFWSSTYDEVIAGEPDLAATADINTTYQNMDTWINSWEYIFFFMIAAILVFLIISASVIDTHPAYFIVAIFALIVFIIIAASLSNAFNEFIDDDSFAEQKDEYSLASNVILYLPIFIFLIGIVVLVILYSKT